MMELYIVVVQDRRCDLGFEVFANADDAVRRAKAIWGDEADMRNEDHRPFITEPTRGTGHGDCTWLWGAKYAEGGMVSVMTTELK